MTVGKVSDYSKILEVTRNKKAPDMVKRRRSLRARSQRPRDPDSAPSPNPTRRTQPKSKAQDELERLELELPTMEPLPMLEDVDELQGLEIGSDQEQGRYTLEEEGA